MRSKYVDNGGPGAVACGSQVHDWKSVEHAGLLVDRPVKQRPEKLKVWPLTCSVMTKLSA
jgi:hypothetical protein